MRDLFPTTLFIVVRLGLILAVAAWVVALLLSPDYVYSTPSYSFDIGFIGTGWCLDDEVTAASFPGFRVWQISGLMLAVSNGVDWKVAHWLVLMSFTSVYGVLKLIYGKRPEAHPCEV